MGPTLFFYDLETSGLRPDSARIMQFAGQRTDYELNPIEEPVNYLIRLSEDVLPDPDAILIHGITPQQTILEGLSEAEFLREFYARVALPDTTFVGFNNVRFDDEFMRYLNYRNLYDPFAWSWEHNNSRWDLLDVVRMTRALRPEGISWPFNTRTGKVINRLEDLAAANNLVHVSAHDAYSDVMASIALAKLVKKTQPKLYDYLFKLRTKEQVAKLVNADKPFIYTSAHYPSSMLHTTVVVNLVSHPVTDASLVYDLRYDPLPWLGKNVSELTNAWRFIEDRSEDDPPLPIKTLKFNRCPAIAPLKVMKLKTDADRLKLDMAKVEQHYRLIKSQAGQQFGVRLLRVVEILDQEYQTKQTKRASTTDTQLYSSFYTREDKKLITELHTNENPEQIRQFRNRFHDSRLKSLCSLFLARNFKSQLTDSERKGWEDYLTKRLFNGGDKSRLAMYFKRIEQLAATHTSAHDQVLLEDLKLYGESLIPASYVLD
jgi:exodeoxyribonuclease-1